MAVLPSAPAFDRQLALIWPAGAEDRGARRGPPTKPPPGSPASTTDFKKVLVGPKYIIKLVSIYILSLRRENASRHAARPPPPDFQGQRAAAGFSPRTKPESRRCDGRCRGRPRAGAVAVARAAEDGSTGRIARAAQGLGGGPERQPFPGG